MFFRFYRAAEGESSRHFRDLAVRRRKVLVPLVRPLSKVGAYLSNPGDSALLAEASNSLDVDVLYVAEAGEFSALVQTLGRAFPGLDLSGGPCLLVVSRDDKPPKVVSAPDEDDVPNFSEFLIGTARRAQDGEPLKGWSEPVVTLEGASGAASILTLLMRLLGA